MCKNEALPRRSTTSAGLGSPYIDLQSSSSWTEQVLAHAFIKWHVHMPTCMWGIWHVVTHVEETHTEPGKKIWADSVVGTQRNSTLKKTLVRTELSNYILFFYRQFWWKNLWKFPVTDSLTHSLTHHLLRPPPRAWPKKCQPIQCSVTFKLLQNFAKHVWHTYISNL